MSTSPDKIKKQKCTLASTKQQEAELSKYYHQAAEEADISLGSR